MRKNGQSQNNSEILSQNKKVIIIIKKTFNYVKEGSEYFKDFLALLHREK